MKAKIRVHKTFDITNQVADKIDHEVDAAITKTALGIEGTVRQNIISRDLIDTSFMLNSVHAERIGPMLWRVSVGAEYGIYHEMGTVFIPARPFFYAAAELWYPRLKEDLRKLNA